MPTHSKPITTSDTTNKTTRKRERGAVTVYEILREDILSLKLAAGSAIDEISLAERFNLSRTPIREALFMLSGESLVTFLANRTSIVTPHSMENANAYFDTLILLSRAVFINAAVERSTEDISRIKSAIVSYQEALCTKDLYQIVTKDINLKHSICNSTNNYFYNEYYPNCLDSGRRMKWLHYYPEATPADLQKTILDMQALIAAIEDRDQNKCDQLAISHVDSIIEVIQRSMVPSVSKIIDLTVTERTNLQFSSQ